MKCLIIFVALITCSLANVRPFNGFSFDNFEPYSPHSKLEGSIYGFHGSEAAVQPFYGFHGSKAEVQSPRLQETSSHSKTPSLYTIQSESDIWGGLGLTDVSSNSKKPLFGPATLPAPSTFSKSAKSQPAVPQPAVPQPAVPQPAVPQPAVPQPAVPQPAVPQPAVSQPAVPQPAVSQPKPKSPPPKSPPPKALPLKSQQTATYPTTTPKASKVLQGVLLKAQVAQQISGHSQKSPNEQPTQQEIEAC